MDDGGRTGECNRIHPARPGSSTAVTTSSSADDASSSSSSSSALLPLLAIGGTVAVAATASLLRLLLWRGRIVARRMGDDATRVWGGDGSPMVRKLTPHARTSPPPAIFSTAPAGAPPLSRLPPPPY